MTDCSEQYYTSYTCNSFYLKNRQINRFSLTLFSIFGTYAQNTTFLKTLIALKGN